MTEKQPETKDFATQCKTLRQMIKTIAEEVNASHEHPIFEDIASEQESNYDEMHANLTLTYRHLEDAAMRLGKAIQAYDGGKSVYD